MADHWDADPSDVVEVIAEELFELGFCDSHPVVHGRRTLSAPDSPVRVLIEPHPASVEILWTGPDLPPWRVTLTADIPAEVALLIVYATVNAHDVGAALAGATAALADRDTRDGG